MNTRKKRIVIVFCMLIMVLMATLFTTQFGNQTFAEQDLSGQMQSLVSNLVQKDKKVRSCVLSVRKGDDSFSWTGAAGFSDAGCQISIKNDTPIYIASITKLFTATAVMRLYEKGLLSLDDPIAKYLPEELIRGINVYHGKDYSREITIRQLLSHTSGIADYYEEKPKGGKSLFEVFLEEPERKWTVDETIMRARDDLKSNFQPGKGASYSDTNYQLLGKIIQVVTEKPLHIVYDELLFQPLGLTHTWLAVYSEPKGTDKIANVFNDDRNISEIRSNGSYWADGGIVSTADEMITFLKALKEGRIVSEKTLRLMHDWKKIEFPLQYGYGTMYFRLPGFMNVTMGIPPLWGHSGSTGSFLYYSEEDDLYMAGTINQVKAKLKPFQLMGKVVKIMKSGR